MTVEKMQKGQTAPLASVTGKISIQLIDDFPNHPYYVFDDDDMFELTESIRKNGMHLPHRAVSVYIYLSDRANKDGECWPAIPTIATELKLSQSTVRRALRDLRKAGLLQTEQRYRSKGGKSSLLYKLRKG